MEGGENRYGRYQDLFAAPTGAALEARYQQIAGGGYNTMHPTLSVLADAASSSTLRSDSEAAKDVCDNSIYSSMDLDEIIISCTLSTTSLASFETCGASPLRALNP